MNSINPIRIDNGTIEIHGYRKMDLERMEIIESDLFEILNDRENTQFVPERFISNKEDINKLLLGIAVGYAMKTKYTHFISLMKFHNKIVGQVDIFSPKHVLENYGISDLWLLEYFINKALWNKGYMTSALGAVLHSLKEQGVKNIGALCRRDNLSSIAVLHKCGFKRVSTFDAKQDLFQL